MLEISIRIDESKPTLGNEISCIIRKEIVQRSKAQEIAAKIRGVAETRYII